MPGILTFLSHVFEFINNRSGLTSDFIDEIELNNRFFDDNDDGEDP